MIKRLILLGALALACGVGIRLTKSPEPSGVVVAAAAATEKAPIPIPGGDERAHWEPLWTSPTPALSAASIASDGTSVAWMSADGVVRRIDGASGRTVWQTPPLDGMNRIVAAPGGDVFVYSYLNRLRPTLRVLDRDKGATKGAVYPLDGAVWSLAVAGGGTAAFASTGRGTVYDIPIRPTSDAPFQRPSNWAMAGIPQTLSVSADATHYLINTWDTRTVSLWDPATMAPTANAIPVESSRWHVDVGDTSRQVFVLLSQNGETAVSLSARGSRGEDPRLEVRDARTGSLLWQEQYDGFGAKVMVSADGRYIALTYARMSEYNSGSLLEHRLCLYTRDGVKAFSDKGGLYFSPELIALSGDGGRITVRSGKSTLYTLDVHGNFRSKLTLPDDPATRVPPSIQDCIPSEDGRSLLILRGDGRISLYHVTPT